MIDESLDVMHWALAHHDPLDWLDAPDLDSWVALFDDTFNIIWTGTNMPAVMTVPKRKPTVRPP